MSKGGQELELAEIKMLRFSFFGSDQDGHDPGSGEERVHRGGSARPTVLEMKGTESGRPKRNSLDAYRRGTAIASAGGRRGWNCQSGGLGCVGAREEIAEGRDGDQSAPQRS